VQLDAVSRGGLPEVTPADLAIAAAGLPRAAFAAAMFSLAGDDSFIPTLRTHLLEHLLAERERLQWTKWAERLDGSRFKFAEPLVALVIAEERAPMPCQTAPSLRADLMGVEPAEWRRVMSHQWACVAGELRRLVIDAEYHVGRRVRG
jgi:hypothetical protein